MLLAMAPRSRLRGTARRRASASDYHRHLSKIPHVDLDELAGASSGMRNGMNLGISLEETTWGRFTGLMHSLLRAGQQD